MDRLWRSNSSVSSRTGCPPDIVNEEDHNVDDGEIPDFNKWTIPRVDTENVYKIGWAESTFHSAYKVRTVEQIFSISKTHEKCCLFSKKSIGEYLASKKFSYLHIGMVQVAIKPLTRKGINASVLMCLHDAGFKNFKDNIFCMANVSLNDHVYFSYYSEASFPYGKTASKEKGDGKFVDSNFDYVKQLRVLTVLNENFEVDLVPLYDEFMLSKNRIKRNIFKIILLNLRKTVLRVNG